MYVLFAFFIISLCIVTSFSGFLFLLTNDKYYEGKVKYLHDNIENKNYLAVIEYVDEKNNKEFCFLNNGKLRGNINNTYLEGENVEIRINFMKNQEDIICHIKTNGDDILNMIIRSIILFVFAMWTVLTISVCIKHYDDTKEEIKIQNKISLKKLEKEYKLLQNEIKNNNLKKNVLV